MNFSRAHFKNPGLIPWLFILFAIATFLALGMWQVKRLYWKEALLNQIHAGQELAPLTALNADPAVLSASQYRRVQLMGEVKRQIYFLRIGIHRDYGNGYYILSPMLVPMADASEPFYIMLNRGFIAGDQKKVIDALEAEKLKNPSMIEGILRAPYAPRLFTPKNHIEENIWASEDVTAMRNEIMHSLGVKTLNLLPYVVEVTHEQPAIGTPAPHANNGEVRLRNDHLGYAITWFSLALIAAVMFASYCYKKE